MSGKNAPSIELTSFESRFFTQVALFGIFKNYSHKKRSTDLGFGFPPILWKIKALLAQKAGVGRLSNAFWVRLSSLLRCRRDLGQFAEVTKRGSRYLRMLFVQAAMVILMRTSRWSDFSFGEDLTRAAERMNRNKLAVARANKLARMAWSILRSKTAFDAPRDEVAISV